MSFHHDPNDNNNNISESEPSDIDYNEDLDDADSLASLESSNQEHTIERVLAETYWDPNSAKGEVDRWLLIKWTNSPVLESSWELNSILDDYPSVREEWEVERKRQEEGKSVPFNLPEFNTKLWEREKLLRQRRKLRRFHKHINHIVTVLQTD